MVRTAYPARVGHGHHDMEILYEDNHLLALNKPAGMLSQGDETGDRSVVDSAMDYLALLREAW